MNKSKPIPKTIKKLSILVEINKALSRTLVLNEALLASLRILMQSYGIKSGVVFLCNNNKKLISTGAAIGFKKMIEEKIFGFDNNILGSIAVSGKPVVIPQASKETSVEKLMKLRESFNKEETFIILPITLDYRTLGLLAVTLPYYPRRDYDSTLKFFTLVASALLQPIRVCHVIEAEKETLINQNVELKQKLHQEYNFDNLIGNSHEMRDVYEQVAKIAKTDTTVLIWGESGTGKELIAEAIHFNSLRSDKPFIKVNCAAIPETLIESEKGAFTGAVAAKKGRFELANQGTIFLDEVGEISLQTQVKLLRVLQSQQFERVGGTETITTDARIITATNANLEKMIENGRFREDLYYRLNIFSIYIPPLRDRKTDTLLLADHFMLKYGRKHRKVIKRISTPAIDMLMRYHWPGNVRELENCIERAVLLCDDQVIHSYHLPPSLQTAESSNTVPRLSLTDAVASYEKELIQDALKTTKGNRARAARLLNTTERIIGYKIKNYNIDVSRFK